jgi:predicted ester cyclase
VRDKVWSHFQGRETNTGPFMGHPATGKPMSLDVIDIGRFDKGKLVEHWGVPDRLAVLLQLGMFPPRAPSAARNLRSTRHRAATR